MAARDSGEKRRRDTEYIEYQFGADFEGKFRENERNEEATINSIKLL